jgi:pimeloyl-ACP methyl ester carboxylesterase
MKFMVLKLVEKCPKYIENLNAIHSAGAENILEKTAKLMLDLGKQPAINPTELEKIKCPVRIAVGDSDKMIPLEAAHQIFKFCRQGSFEVLPETRHEIDRVNPELLAQNLIRFFN